MAEITAETLAQDWQDNPRWATVRRDYTPADVMSLRGKVQEEFTLAKRGAEILWGEITQGDGHYVNALGALTGALFSDSDDRLEGALIGGAVGGVAERPGLVPGGRREQQDAWVGHGDRCRCSATGYRLWAAGGFRPEARVHRPVARGA